jgi:hypothetical protein
MRWEEMGGEGWQSWRAAGTCHVAAREGRWHGMVRRGGRWHGMVRRGGQGRQRVREALAAARRHDDEYVAVGKGGVDDRALRRADGAVSKDEMRREKMGWDGIRWDGMRWDGMRWDEMGWDETG